MISESLFKMEIILFYFLKLFPDEKTHVEMTSDLLDHINLPSSQ